MRTIPKEQVLKLLQTENPWWNHPFEIHDIYAKLKKREYFRLFYPLVQTTSVKRAVLLMGPRRVGKTVLMHQVIDELIKAGTQGNHVCYISVDHPIYNGLSLQEILDYYLEASGVSIAKNQLFIFFDEIQYLKEWEVHLKILVDSHPNIKFVASGSSAAALRLKSLESGAGRFTDFLLPPLTFHEYLTLLGKSYLLRRVSDSAEDYEAADIEELNSNFLDYLNYGGYPEVVFSDTIQSDPGRFIKSDIIDRVLLRDLPSLYGIDDIQELNYLFTTLAFNTAAEVSLEELAKNSGVSKNTIKRYIEYLEAAFLIKIVHRIDRTAKRFQRANYFKVYLTNPSMWCALFGKIEGDNPAIGALAETAIFSQWFHSKQELYYARWNDGEVDIVRLGLGQKPFWAVEVKWSDRFANDPKQLRSLISFCNYHELREVRVTSRTIQKKIEIAGLSIPFVPASVYCWLVGYNLVSNRKPVTEDS